MQHTHLTSTNPELKSIHINKFASTMSHNQMSLIGLSLALNLASTVASMRIVQMQKT